MTARLEAGRLYLIHASLTEIQIGTVGAYGIASVPNKSGRPRPMF